MAQTQCNPSSDPGAAGLPWARAGQDWQDVALQLRLLLSCGISVAIAPVVGARSRHTAPCVWSPRLDKHGNSVRGIELCRRLVAAYNVHVFDSLHADPGQAAKRDPRRKKNQTQTEAVVALTWAASQGDLTEVRALVAADIEPGTADYDGRTPLHLAAAEGQIEVVHYLLAAGAGPHPVDRWGGTSLTDAEASGHTEIAAVLQEHAERVAPLPHRAGKREATAV